MSVLPPRATIHDLPHEIRQEIIQQYIETIDPHGDPRTLFIDEEKFAPTKFLRLFPLFHTSRLWRQECVYAMFVTSIVSIGDPTHLWNRVGDFGYGVFQSIKAVWLQVPITILPSVEFQLQLASLMSLLPGLKFMYLRHIGRGRLIIPGPPLGYRLDNTTWLPSHIKCIEALVETPGPMFDAFMIESDDRDTILIRAGMTAEERYQIFRRYVRFGGTLRKATNLDLIRNERAQWEETRRVQTIQARKTFWP